MCAGYINIYFLLGRGGRWCVGGGAGVRRVVACVCVVAARVRICFVVGCNNGGIFSTREFFCEGQCKHGRGDGGKRRVFKCFASVPNYASVNGMRRERGRGSGWRRGREGRGGKGC